jgi:IS5 family transposase
LGRNYLAHRAGDAANAILAEAGYDFRLILRWLKVLCLQILTAMLTEIQTSRA